MIILSAVLLTDRRLRYDTYEYSQKRFAAYVSLVCFPVFSVAGYGFVHCYDGCMYMSTYHIAMAGTRVSPRRVVADHHLGNNNRSSATCCSCVADGACGSTYATSSIPQLLAATLALLLRTLGLRRLLRESRPEQEDMLRASRAAGVLTPRRSTWSAAGGQNMRCVNICPKST